MKKDEYIFKSNRLGFRNWLKKDLDEFAKLNSDEVVMEHFPKTRSKKEVEKLIDRLKKHFAENGFTYYATEILETKEFIGMIGLAYQEYKTDFTPAIDIGWRLKRSAWGKGYATEGAKRCIEYAFSELDIRQIIAVCTIKNKKSENVMKKIGMTKKGEFNHPEMVDYPAYEKHFCYEITKSSTITIHMVSSLDGFIAKKDGSVAWMRSTDNYEKGIELTKEYITAFLDAIDCYVMGSRTYEHAVELGWPYGDVPVFVLTTRKLKSHKKSVQFISGDLTQIVTERLKPQYANIWMVGGTMLTKEFLRLGLADEINISIVPILLGSGTLFFDYIGKEQLLHLKKSTAFKDGMVELSYEIKNRDTV